MPDQNEATVPVPQGATLGDPIPVPQGATLGEPVKTASSTSVPVPQGATLGAPVTAPAQPEDSGFGHRFMEGAGLPAELPKPLQPNLKDIAVAAFAPAVAAYHAARAPMIHAENLYKAIKDGDGEAAAMHLGNFLDSFIPGSANAQQLSQETMQDVQEGNLEGVAGTTAGLVTRAALAKGVVSGTSKLTPGNAAREAAEGPGIIKQVFKGEEVAQPQAQAALRKGVAAGAEEAGVTTVQPESLRVAAEEPIHALETQSKANYRQIDKAAGTDFKALNEKLENAEYQIRQLTDSEEDVIKESQLEKGRQATIDKIASAKQQAIDNGVSPKLLDEADAQFKKASALKEFEAKFLKNPNIISGNSALGAEESINVDQAVKVLQKLQDSSKYGGSRLEQALGEKGAQTILQDMYDAQKTGIKALTKQQWAKRIGKVLGFAGGEELARHLWSGAHSKDNE